VVELVALLGGMCCYSKIAEARLASNSTDLIISDRHRTAERQTVGTAQDQKRGRGWGFYFMLLRDGHSVTRAKSNCSGQ
jgi:hypothetical protein